MPATKTGLLLVNLGTPDAPRTPEVRRYLREFLNDPRVIDINPLGRAALVNLIILPTRPRKSAHAYQAIWDAERGSPLLYHSRSLTAAVANALGQGWHVELAMRYGNPSLEAGLTAMAQAGVDHIVVLPLYPQYASSSTGSTAQRVWELAKAKWNTPYLTVVPAFYDDPAFIAAFATVTTEATAAAAPDHYLFSFHGLPERHVEKSDASGTHCLRNTDCCAAISTANRNCYRAQCFATARALARALALPQDRYSVSFQSRLGKTPWIRPYTDDVLHELAQRGVKDLAVVCPAFVADCLETLEEIAMRAQETFIAAGGTRLRLVPSLNAHPTWVQAVVAMAHRFSGSPQPT